MHLRGSLELHWPVLPNRLTKCKIIRQDPIWLLSDRSRMTIRPHTAARLIKVSEGLRTLKLERSSQINVEIINQIQALFVRAPEFVTACVWLSQEQPVGVSIEPARNATPYGKALYGRELQSDPAPVEHVLRHRFQVSLAQSKRRRLILNPPQGPFVGRHGRIGRRTQPNRSRRRPRRPHLSA
jgi:hypothetical protein